MKSKIVRLNIGSGITLLRDFINCDKYIDYKELLKGAKTKKGKYRNATV